MTTTTKLGKMLENGKLVLMDEDGIAELDNFVLIVTENGIDHTLIRKSSVGTLIKACVETAYRNGIEDKSLCKFLAEMIAEVYGKDEDEE